MPPKPGAIVPDFSPFAGVRYDSATAGAELDAVVAPPYDVIDEEQRALLEAADPRNSVRLILPRDGTTEGDRYARAAATFDAWLAEGVLRSDPEPRFYSYRMDFGGSHGERRHTLGVIGALALPEAGDTSVLPHERTLPKAKSDRLALLRATRTNLDPIWALSLTDGLTALFEPAVPLAHCIDADGVEHHLGAIDHADRVAAIRDAVAASPLVLADGHHRFETACNFRNELRSQHAEVGGAAAIMTFVVELAEQELCIEPIHRLLELPDGVDVRDRLADAFDFSEAGANTPDAVDALLRRMHTEGGIGIVDAKGLAVAVPRAQVCDAALAGEAEPVARTDAALVEAVVVPRLPEATWEYRHDAPGVAGLVDKGLARAAVLLRPVSVADARAAAISGARMPQKTTFFAPKPRTGAVFRRLA